MKSDAPALKLNGILRGDLQRIIDSANRSPVEKWLKNFTTDMTGRGPADLDLFLSIDLKNFQNSGDNEGPNKSKILGCNFFTKLVS